MAYEKLKKLLKEWEHFEKLKNTLPSRIVKHEKKSIATAVDLVVKEMKDKNEYDQVSEEEQKLIEEIIDLLEKDNFG